jgi:hypothetical protein
MANFYAAQQIGVADGTKSPPDRPDGRLVGAKMSSIACSKKSGEVWAQADKVYLGRLNAGDSLREVLGTAGVSLGTTVLSIGTLAVPAKYVNAKALTAVDIPTPLGPFTSNLIAAPLTAPEDLWLTFGVGGVAGPTDLNLDLRISSVK